jgi:hypothetical protein
MGMTGAPPASARAPLVSINRLPEAFHRFLEARAAWVIAGFSVVYWLATYHVAATKPLWNDEIVTRYVAALPFGSILRVLPTGIDTQTPLFYWLTHHTGANGDPVGLRLPGMAGLWIAALALYAFVARRTTRVRGLFAMFLPFLLAAGGYAYDARPYGLFLGAVSVTMLCWQMAIDTNRRPWTLLFLWAAASFAIALYYQGVLALVPLGVAELVRWRGKGKPDWPLWCAVLLAGFPLVLEFPLMRALKSAMSDFWTQPKILGSTYEFFVTFMSPALPLIAALLVAVLLGISLYRSRSFDTPPLASEAIPEVAAIAASVALPLLYVLVGLYTGAFTPRYAIAGVWGICAGAGYVLSRHRAVAACCVLLALLHFAALETLKLRKTEHPRAIHPPMYSEQLPIVMSGPNEFIEANYYAPPDIAARLYYISEPQMARHYVNTSVVDLVSRRLLGIAPLHVASYAEFMSQHPRFLVVYRREEVFGWILQKLREDGATITLRNQVEDEIVYEVQSKP